MITPIVNLGEYKNNHLYVKREDLLPFSFGGNKYRIVEEIINDFLRGGYDCIIGYGNARSNLCRVISNVAYSKNILCYIISPSDDDGNRIETANSKIVSSCNTRIIYCSKQDVLETVNNLILTLQQKGLKPYYIYGDSTGKGNEQILSKAYISVFDEILKQESESGIKFDYLFLPAGTGMTYSGLVLGKIKNKSSLKLVGVSVARDSSRCYAVLNEYLNAYNLSLDSFNNKLIEFCDEYLCGGYGNYDDNIQSVIEYSMKQFGMPLDPTYTAKAFYGMSSYLEKNSIKDKNILFLHTGGTPLFFDYIKGLD